MQQVNFNTRTIHPAITAADLHTMTVAELDYFTDAPVAHAKAFRDFQEAELRERRQEATRQAILRRMAAARHG